MMQKKRPVVSFELAPQLTKRVTVLLYRWILVSHLYMYYTAIQDEVKSHPEMSRDDILAITDRKEGEKVQRRNALMERYNVDHRQGEEYRITLQKAYYTYKGSDEEFDKEMTKMIQDYSVLLGKMYSMEKIPEFVKDPFDMQEKEFEDFYNNLLSVHLAPKPEPAPAPAAAPAEKRETLSGAENVDSVLMPPSEIKVRPLRFTFPTLV